MVHVIVSGALLDGDRVLLGHRSTTRRDYPNCWSLPGGHVEAGEEPTAALIRELREELGVDADVHGSPSLRIERDPANESGMIQDVWAIRTWRGRPRNLAMDEHDALRWVSAAELSRLDLAHPEHAQFLREFLPVD